MCIKVKDSLTKGKIIYTILALFIAILISLTAFFILKNKAIKEGSINNGANKTLVIDPLIAFGITLLLFGILALISSFGFGKEFFKTKDERKLHRLKVKIQDEKNKNNPELAHRIYIKDLEKQKSKLENTINKTVAKPNRFLYYLLITLGSIAMLVAIILSFAW